MPLSVCVRHFVQVNKKGLWWRLLSKSCYFSIWWNEWTHYSFFHYCTGLGESCEYIYIRSIPIFMAFVGTSKPRNMVDITRAICNKIREYKNHTFKCQRNYQFLPIHENWKSDPKTTSGYPSPKSYFSKGLAPLGLFIASVLILFLTPVKISLYHIGNINTRY